MAISCPLSSRVTQCASGIQTRITQLPLSNGWGPRMEKGWSCRHSARRCASSTIQSSTVLGMPSDIQLGGSLSGKFPQTPFMPGIQTRSAEKSTLMIRPWLLKITKRLSVTLPNSMVTSTSCCSLPCWPQAHF